jgi:hypothetical protein
MIKSQQGESIDPPKQGNPDIRRDANIQSNSRDTKIQRLFPLSLCSL